MPRVGGCTRYQQKALTKSYLDEQTKQGDGKWQWVVPNDGVVAWVGWVDLGEGTAKIIAAYEEYLGQTVKLTGPRSIHVSDVARIASEETGVEVEIKSVGKEAAKEYHLQRQSAGEGRDWVVESWVGWYDGLENGECAVVDPLLGDLIGRQPKGIEELKDQLFKVAG